MKLPTKISQKDIDVRSYSDTKTLPEVLTLAINKINEVIDFIEYFIRETGKCCTCNGCPKHKKKDNRKSTCNDCFDGDHVQCSGGGCMCPCPKSLAQKFQAFREKRGNGSGTDYWEGLEDIANEYYHQI